MVVGHLQKFKTYPLKRTADQSELLSPAGKMLLLGLVCQ